MSLNFLMLGRIKLETVCHATEDPEKIRQALDFVINGNPEYAVSKTRGFYGNPITLFSIEFTSRKACAALIDFWKSNLPAEGRQQITRELENRFEDNKIFLKFDLAAALENKLVLGNDHAIAVEITVKLFPTSAEKALAEFRELFA